VTLKSVLDVAVPAADFTVILPVFIPASTRAVILVHDTTVKRAFLPPKVTVVTPQKPEPMIVTRVPAFPFVGVKRVMTGITRNALVVAETPPGDDNLILPELAPAGTRSMSWVSETTVKVAGFPSTVTAVTPENPEPVIVTKAPTLARLGVKLVICGAIGAASVTCRVAVPVALPLVAVTV
jgi:hypothetical protein